MGKYSQNNEDQVILDYFKGKAGTFIDIGANDGKTLSNTRALVEAGWDGVFVEPSPTAFQKLKEYYEGQTAKGQKLYFYNFALGTTNQKVEFFDSGVHLGKGDHGLLSTLVDEERSRWPGQQYEKIEVQCYRWKTFLNRLSIRAFDVISLDAEGLDLAILEQIDLRETCLVCVEWNSKPELKDAFDKLCIGFNVIYTSPENLIYAR